MLTINTSMNMTVIVFNASRLTGYIMADVLVIPSAVMLNAMVQLVTKSILLSSFMSKMMDVFYVKLHLLIQNMSLVLFVLQLQHCLLMASSDIV